MRRRTFLGSTVALTTPLVAGCAGGDGGGGGSDGSGGDGGSDSSGGGGGYGGGGGGGGGSTTTAGSGGGDAQSTYPDYTWDQLSDADPTETTDVTIRNFAFHPLVAAVSTGAEVTFTNEDSGSHTVTIPAMDVDEQLSGGSSTTVTFDEAGTFDYVCTFHSPDMLGRVVVG